MTDTLFVTQTGKKKNDPNTRTFIRRHVMLGKNQGRKRNPKQPTLAGCAVFQKDDWKRDVQPVQSIVPRRVGSDLSFLEFAEAVDPPLMSDTLHFCSDTDKKLFMLEPCISFRGSTDTTAMCIQSFASDALHLNIMVFGTLVYTTQMFRQTTSELRRNSYKATRQHYGQALFLLRKRLANSESQRHGVSDMTFISVILLAMHALVTGDVQSATNHVVGLSKLVSMKESGVYAFKNSTKHMIEILRCDLSVSLATGRMPLFFLDSFREPMFPLPVFTAPDETTRRYPIIVDSELSKVWDVLSRFCARINEVAADRKKVSDQFLLETMASVMYRVLHMSFATDSTDETTRLAIISFCASTLLPLRQLRTPFGWLQLEYRRSLAGLMKHHLRLLNPEVVLWYLMTYVTAFSPLVADDSNGLKLWLMEVIDLCGLATWDDIKRILGKFLWINIVCDFGAEKFVKEAFAMGVAAIDVVDLPIEQDFIFSQHGGPD